MLKVVKAHAYGNDFLLVSEADLSTADPPAIARRLCDRHRGIGADGLIVYRRQTGGAAMRLLNADGSPSEVSGNGVRCLGAWMLQTAQDAGHRVELNDAARVALSIIDDYANWEAALKASAAARQLKELTSGTT